MQNWNLVFDIHACAVGLMQLNNEAKEEKIVTFFAWRHFSCSLHCETRERRPPETAVRAQRAAGTISPPTNEPCAATEAGCSDPKHPQLDFNCRQRQKPRVLTM